MALKLVAVFLLLCLCDIHCQSHDLILGSVGPNGYLLATFNQKKMAVPLSVRTGNIDYPPKGISQLHTITAIHVKDMCTGDKGGYAYITSGGIGQSYVRLSFKSKRGGPLNFMVSIYGR